MRGNHTLMFLSPFPSLKKEKKIGASLLLSGATEERRSTVILGPSEVKSHAHIPALTRPPLLTERRLAACTTSSVCLPHGNKPEKKGLRTVCSDLNVACYFVEGIREQERNTLKTAPPSVLNFHFGAYLKRAQMMPNEIPPQTPDFCNHRMYFSSL